MKTFPFLEHSCLWPHESFPASMLMWDLPYLLPPQVFCPLLFYAPQCPRVNLNAIKQVTHAWQYNTASC